MRTANETDLGSRGVLPVRDRCAFERAVMPCCGSLRISALHLTKNASEADDLLQETLLRAWRFWPRYREQDHCRGWLQRIMTNTFCSERRSYTRRRTQLCEYAQLEQSAGEAQAVAGYGEPRQPHRRVSHELLACSLSALKPEHRHILRMVDVDERSYRETADALGCPIGTVMSRLHRARAALRSELTRASHP